MQAGACNSYGNRDFPQKSKFRANLPLRVFGSKVCYAMTHVLAAFKRKSSQLPAQRECHEFRLDLHKTMLSASLLYNRIHVGPKLL